MLLGCCSEPSDRPPAQPGDDADSDGDYLSDAEEALHGTDPANPDTDADGFAGEIYWVTILFEDATGAPAEAGDVTAWHDAYPNPNIAVIGDDDSPKARRRRRRVELGAQLARRHGADDEAPEKT